MATLASNDPVVENASENKETTKQPPKQPIAWSGVMLHGYLYFSLFYGFYLLVTSKVMLLTFLFYAAMIYPMSLGMGAGAHRMWSHRAYKARWPLRLFLAFCNTLAFQMPVYKMVRDHRTHHKYVDTYADPHDSTRGLFYSHIGWLLVHKTKDTIEKGKTIDLTDMKNDWIVMLQNKYYVPLVLLIVFYLPVSIPVYFWGESVWNAWFINSMRINVGHHISFSINSFGHTFGAQPYNKDQTGRENKTISLVSLGEGWHNYHHMFPWDYRASEIGHSGYNPATTFINFCAWLGLAYDLKFPSDELVRKSILKTGDGSHPHSHKAEIWELPSLNKDEVKVKGY